MLTLWHWGEENIYWTLTFVVSKMWIKTSAPLLQGVSIACYADPCISHCRNVRPSICHMVRPSVTCWCAKAMQSRITESSVTDGSRSLLSGFKFSCRILEMVQARTKVTIDHWQEVTCVLLVGTGTKIFNLGWPWTAVIHSVCFSAPTIKNLMNIDPHYPQQKFSLETIVSDNIRFMWIFAEWFGITQQWGCQKQLFLVLSGTMSSELLEIRPTLLCGNM